MKCKYCGMEMVRISSDKILNEVSYWCINCGTLMMEEKEIEKWLNPQHNFKWDDSYIEKIQ